MTTQPFNVDDRATERENAAITIGGVAYTRARRTNKLSFELEALGRTQQRLAAKSRHLTGKLDAELDDGKAKKLEGELGQVSRQAVDLSYQTIARQLHIPGGNAEPDPAVLAEQLDMEDVTAVLKVLAGRDPDAVDEADPDQVEPDPSTRTATTPS